jgi:hypothetical protein
MASAPIIWPPSLAEQQQQQLAFLWEQIDPRDQAQYLQELYRFNPPYLHPQLPENAVRGVEPIRLMNQFGQVVNLVEESADPGETDTSNRDTSDMKLESDGNEDSVTSIPMMSRDGRLVYLIR